MRIIEVKQGQTFFDVVIEATGNVTSTFEVAEINKLSITDNVFIGQKIQIPDNISKKEIFTNGHYPASKESTITNESGLDYLLPQTLPHI